MVSHKGAWWAAIPVLFLSLFSCGNDNILFETEVKFDAGVWPVEDILPAQWDVEDTTALYRWSVTIHHSDRFKYQNLYLLIKSSSPGSEDRNQEISLQLANPKTGQWLGKSSGSEIVLKSVIQDSIEFRHTGKYQFEVEQYSRDSLLQNIHSIKMTLEKIANKKNKG